MAKHKQKRSGKRAKGAMPAKARYKNERRWIKNAERRQARHAKRLMWFEENRTKSLARKTLKWARRIVERIDEHRKGDHPERLKPELIMRARKLIADNLSSGTT